LPVLGEFARYLRTETVGGYVLLGATAVALLSANGPWQEAYFALRDTELAGLTVADWAKDGLLALFFFVAGLELKRELVVGELSRLKNALLPVIAAVGGMVVPALVALAVGWGDPRIGDAWPIPVATDIAFALGVLALTASNLPASARVFLLSLAVVDDLGAIVLIAILFTASIDLLAAAAAVVLLGLYWLAQRRRIRTPLLYVPIAAATWFAVHEMGVHATIAGVALALLTRVRTDPGEEESPCLRLEHRLQPWSAGFAVPVFALFAAGIPISADVLGRLFSDRLALAVIIGLVVGKLVGIVGAALVAVWIGAARLPDDLGKRDLVAVAMLGGVGFTVSLLLADLSLDGADMELAKGAVLIGSLVASLVAAILLRRRSRAHSAS
jgi:Na+:H+ antiporter, NhaA family